MRSEKRARVFVPALFFSLAATAGAQPAIDFSYAGYGGGGVSAPTVPAAISVRPTGGDDTELLQQAIDHVSALPVRENGFRGAVLLRPGRYRVAGHLEMRTGGVVLRGSGNATIVATGTGRRTLIEIGGVADAATGPLLNVTDETVPAGGLTLTLETAAGLRPGDRIAITRPSTAVWIAALGMSGLPGTYANQRLDWAPGSRNLVWDRTVVAVDAARRQVTLDAPVTTALERRYGGGTVARERGGDGSVQRDLPARGIDRHNRAVPNQVARPRSPVQPLVGVGAWEAAHPQSRDPYGGAGTGDRDTVAGAQASGGLKGQRESAGGHGLIRHVQ